MAEEIFVFLLVFFVTFLPWILFFLIFVGGTLYAIYWYFKNRRKEEELEGKLKDKGTKNY